MSIPSTLTNIVSFFSCESIILCTNHFFIFLHRFSLHSYPKEKETKSAKSYLQHLFRGFSLRVYLYGFPFMLFSNVPFIWWQCTFQIPLTKVSCFFCTRLTLKPKVLKDMVGAQGGSRNFYQNLVNLFQHGGCWEVGHFYLRLSLCQYKNASLVISCVNFDTFW